MSNARIRHPTRHVTKRGALMIWGMYKKLTKCLEVLHVPGELDNQPLACLVGGRHRSMLVAGSSCACRSSDQESAGDTTRPGGWALTTRLAPAGNAKPSCQASFDTRLIAFTASRFTLIWIPACLAPWKGSSHGKAVAVA